MGGDTQHAVGRLDYAEAEAAPLIVLDADEHAVKAIEIELLRERRSEDGRLHPPTLERSGQSASEGIRLAQLPLGWRRRR